MCDVPSIGVFCSESIEWFPGIVSKFFFKLLVTIPVAPIITGTIIHFRFHILASFNDSKVFFRILGYTWTSIFLEFEKFVFRCLVSLWFSFKNFVEIYLFSKA